MPFDKLLSGIESNPALFGALGGAASGALVTAMLDKKSATTLVKAGGLVAVGGLAWFAYQRYKNGKSGATPDIGATVLSSVQPDITPDVALIHAAAQTVPAISASYQEQVVHQLEATCKPDRSW
jgi:uncharacterized membrane protein YebE (DUF533 family)